jgi:hypothetical protein
VIKGCFGRWKANCDEAKGRKVQFLLRSMWDENSRKDVLLVMQMRTDYSVAELEELSNIFGREAHDKARELEKE